VTEIRHSYEATADVVFEYDPEKVDPFYYTEIVDGQEQRVWRMQGIYDITDEAGMWDHLAYNAIVNGVTDASRLDGWAELERGELTMRVREATVERV